MKARSALIIALCMTVPGIADVSAAVALRQLTCEGLSEPMLIEVTAPRLGWQLAGDARGLRQSAYELRLTALAPDGQPAATGRIATGRVSSDQSQWVAVSGFAAKPKTRYQWQVRIWDGAGKESAWSEPAHFETGVMGRANLWTANWIGDGRAVPLETTRSARYFRTEFNAASAPAKARLYLSSYGLVEPWLNGGKVGKDHFVPGWPDYRRRVFYVAYDVTNQIRAGRNALGIIQGDGWYSSTLVLGIQAGSQPSFSAQLELIDAAGKVTTVTSGKDWQWAEGPILEQSIYHGETYDARRADPRWCETGGTSSAWAWRPAVVQGKRPTMLTARLSPPVREIEELRPVEKRHIRPGVWLFDLGQNMVGWVRLKLQAPAGTEVTVRHAEMLEAPDRIHTANLREARATARYTARGEGVETWEPRFSFFGFRYVEVSGLEEPRDDAVTGVVLHSDLPRIGEFECSHPLLNKLFLNTIWGQKGNFLEVPTDCPQRNERLGWTGDAQVFAHTANFNFACGAFYRQWLAAVRDSYRDEPGGASGFGDVAPESGLSHGSAGWGDAAVIVPWVTWLHTGDRRILEENMDSTQAWVEAQTRDYPAGIRRSSRSYGDWLAPGYHQREAPTPYVLIATAYYGHVTYLAARMAAVLGRPALAARNRALFEHIRAAFRKEFITDDGRVRSDEQTAYLLALGFGLVPDELKAKTVGHLVRTVRAKNDHLATGFLGTPLLTPVLGAVGQGDLAYRVLQQETYPGWLFSVKNGATTIWERWDSWTPEKGFHPDGMNSFNHYAYGSVIGWFYDTIAGLKPEADGAGWKRFTIAPTPGGGLTHARATLLTPYGRAASAWRIEGGRFALEITVPANTSARVSVPAAAVDQVSEGGRPLSAVPEFTGLAAIAGRVTFTAAAGTYRLTMPSLQQTQGAP
jgi:alpha-L-rhamnosidase